MSQFHALILNHGDLSHTTSAREETLDLFTQVWKTGWQPARVRPAEGVPTGVGGKETGLAVTGTCGRVVLATASSSARH